MRDRAGLVVLALIALSLAAAGTGLGPSKIGFTGGVLTQGHDGPEHALTLEAVAIECPAGFDNGHDDDVCLAYDGQIPGPALHLQKGDDVSITLVNRIPETLDALEIPADVRADLADTHVSLHRHGVSTPVAQDGVAAIDGTNIPDSSAAPGSSFTYRFTIPWRGTWHYHDHVMGPGGEDGQARGLFGTMIVTLDEDPDEQLVDLHLLDAGANGGMGQDAVADTDAPIRLAISGLGNWWWNVRLTHPSGGLVGTVDVGPGVSRALHIPNPEAGTYTWTARSQIGDQAQGTITVEPAASTSAGHRHAPSHLSSPAQPPAQAPGTPGLVTGHRVFTLIMEGNGFNGETWPETPLLEAYASERLTFVVHVPAWAEAHTFHLHGHPWHDPEFGRFIDTKLLKPGETHVFNVTAGLSEGHTGDWLYHCHVDQHFAEGMLGVLRVYPIALDVSGPLDALDVRASYGGDDVEGVHWSATLDGRSVDVDATERPDGRYVLDPALAAGATGELVLTADKPGVGQSVARLEVSPGGYELVRDVGDPDALGSTIGPLGDDGGSGPDPLGL